LRTSSGSRRKSSPSSSITSNAQINTLSSTSHRRISSKHAIPSGPHATASPSMMHERGRSRVTASAIRGKLLGQVVPGRLYSGTRMPFFRAMTRKPSCLISCSQHRPEGGRGAQDGRHRAMKPADRARGRNIAR
jgi:hypothetical protein